jgi:hypothetical protein
MEDAAFSDEFCGFLRGAVPTVDAAELLLLIERERWWTADEAARALQPGASLNETDATRYFGIFQGKGLVATGEDRRVQYRPAFGELDAHVRTLAREAE